MARTDSYWETVDEGTYIKTIAPAGYDILVNGSNKYLNFNTVVGSLGYGFRDNSGTMQFKNSGGTWSAFAPGGSGPVGGLTLSDVSTNSLTTPNSLYTMTAGIPVEFRTSSASPLLYLNETLGTVGIGTNTPTAKLEINAGTLLTTKNAILLNATLADSSSPEVGFQANIASAGSGSNANRGVIISLNAGYTGSGITVAARSSNMTTGTAADAWFGSANFGGEYRAIGTTVGHNAGISGVAQNSSTLNLGGVFRAISGTNSPLLNTGITGFALNGTTNVGGLFLLIGTGTPTISGSAGLIADNGATTDAIFIAQDNGTAVFNIIDGGNVGIGIAAPTAKLHIVGGTLTTTTNALSISATIPASNTVETGINIQITSSGSGASQNNNGLVVNMIAGYTGDGNIAAASFTNRTAGTGTGGWVGNNFNNGLATTARATTAGHNVGNFMTAQNSSSLNLAGIGSSVNTNNSPALNVGLAGFALNATVNVGGFFGLMNTAPTLGSSAALIADNGSTTSDIFVARDNGTAVFTIADGGAMTSTVSLSVGGMLFDSSGSRIRFAGGGIVMENGDNHNVLLETGNSLTGSSAASNIDLSRTWNTSGTPTAIKLNITDTASNAASLLMDLQKGGTSQFKVSKAGNVTILGTTTLATSLTGILRADSGVVSVATGVGTKTVFDHFVNANNVTTGETDLYSDTLSAGQLANNGEKIVAQYGGTFVGDATSTQRLKLYFGGTLIFDTGALGIGVTTANWDIGVTVIRVSSSVVRTSVCLTSSFATLNAYDQYTEVTGLTLANTQILKITGTAAGVTAASDQISAKEGFVEWKPAG